jgi:hypothetical protein
MTLEDVEAQLGKIREMAAGADSEEAHLLEDAMHASVLEAIADGRAADPAQLARTALSSSEIRFERWYA